MRSPCVLVGFQAPRVSERAKNESREKFGTLRPRVMSAQWKSPIQNDKGLDNSSLSSKWGPFGRFGGSFEEAQSQFLLPFAPKKAAEPPDWAAGAWKGLV
jgi:hypothetical protein